jgi:hypothetical protein
MGPTPKCHFVSIVPFGNPEIPKIGIPATLEAHNFLCKFQLKWSLKKICNLYQGLSNGMWHATCTQVNYSDSWLLEVRSQVANLIPNLSLSHNLCFKYPNGSSELILDIHVSRAFQWHKKLFNSMIFDPYNHLLKIQESTRIPIPKVGAHLGVWGFIPL